LGLLGRARVGAGRPRADDHAGGADNGIARAGGELGAAWRPKPGRSRRATRKPPAAASADRRGRRSLAPDPVGVDQRDADQRCGSLEPSRGGGVAARIEKRLTIRPNRAGPASAPTKAPTIPPQWRLARELLAAVPMQHGLQSGATRSSLHLSQFC
jgi:hypothetical protein